MSAALSENSSKVKCKAQPCTHCGLPSQTTEEGELPFCCSGCRGAYHLIQEWGLDEYYDLREVLGGSSEAEIIDENIQFFELDDVENFGDRAPTILDDGLMRCRLAVHGMHCAACGWLIENASKKKSGLLNARVRMNDQSVELLYDPKKVLLSDIGKFFSSLGYRIAPMTAEIKQKMLDQENRQQLVQISVAGFCAANAMWLAIAIYAGQFTGISAEHFWILHSIGVLLSICSVLGPGRVFFRGAMASIRTRTPHMDLPIAIGLGVGAVAGALSVAVGRGEAYFDSVAMLVFLLLIGRWVQFRQQRKTIDTIAGLMRLVPRYANRVSSDGTTLRVNADRLVEGDLICVMSGETFPADGLVVSGSTDVDRSLVSGESTPVRRSIGDFIEAGCCNVTSVVQLKVAAIGENTQVGKLASLIEEAAVRRAPIVQLADRISSRFVVAILSIAAVTFLVWATFDVSSAIRSTVALLIVACPCALALATPLAISCAVGRSAKKGILIRGGDTLERIDRSGIIWFDKTGTLTLGKMKVLEFSGNELLFAKAASLERGSEHFIAKAIIEYADRLLIEQSAAQDIKRIPGGGLAGLVDRARIQVGNLDSMRSASISVDAKLRTKYEKYAMDGLTPILVSCNGIAQLAIGLGDAIRPGTAELVERLRVEGWRVGILSGDHARTVVSVSEQLGIESYLAVGNATPEQKLRIINDSKESGLPVVMVGDGINDSAALAASDVGIAIRGSAAASLDAAPVYLTGGKLELIEKFFEASERTRRTIRTNFRISLSYNAIAITLAAVGAINPLIAAVLMPVSSLTVLSVILIRRTFV